jgi:leucine dehydrogenase
VAGIGDTLRRVFAESEARGVTPLEAAERLAGERLTSAQHQGAPARERALA